MTEQDRARTQADRYHAAFTEGTGMPNPRPERRAMTTDPIEAARLDAIRAICRTEGHRWIEVGSYSDLPFRRAMCGRGCGRNRHELWRGSSVDLERLAALLADTNGTITSIEIVSEG